MFSFLFKLISKAFKKGVTKNLKKLSSGKKKISFGKRLVNKITRPIDKFKRLFKGASKAATKSGSGAKESLYRQKNGSGRTTNKLTGYSSDKTKGMTKKEKLVDQIIKKSGLIEKLKNQPEEILRGTSNASIERTEIVKEILKYPKSVKHKNMETLNDINELLNNELGELGVTNENFEEVATNERTQFDLSKQNAYNTHMNQWRERFYDSDDTQQLSDGEKDEIWDEIENEKTFEWFVERKVYGNSVDDFNTSAEEKLLKEF